MPLIIQDRLIVASIETGRNPAGEVSGRTAPLLLMTPEARAAMLLRLEKCILTEVMEEAGAAHEKNSLKKGAAPDPDYITRVATNEFFFYTKEPLTLEEFESLQNKIAEKAKTLPAGIQYILSSFAVKTDDDKVMNVTPIITCGASPSIHLLVKNYTSSIDVRYKVPDDKWGDRLLAPLDRVNTGELPKIVVDGSPIAFTFDPIIPCKTPAGTPYLTAVEVCLDHLLGMAKLRHEELLKETPALSDLITTHVVVSNTIEIDPDNTLSHYVAHADPVYLKPASGDTEFSPRRLMFGLVRSRLFETIPLVLYERRAAPVAAPALAPASGGGGDMGARGGAGHDEHETLKGKYEGIKDKEGIPGGEASKNPYKGI